MSHAPYVPLPGRERSLQRLFQLSWAVFVATLGVLEPAVAQTVTPDHPATGLEPSNSATVTTLEATFRQADEQFQAANYSHAAALFTRVWELSLLPENQNQWGRYAAVFAFNAATSHRLARDCKAAHTAYSQYLSAFEQLTSEQQQTLREATDLPRDNGAWRLELNEECPDSTTETLPAVQQPQRTETVQPLPAAAPASGNWLLDLNVPAKLTSDHAPHPVVENGTSPLGWALTVSGAASLAVSGYFLWSGLQNDNDAMDPVNKHKPYADYTEARDRDYIAAGILGGLGIGLASVGVYLLTTAPSEIETTQGISHPKLWLFSNGTQLGLGGAL